MRTIQIPNELLLPNYKAYNCALVDNGQKMHLFYRYEYNTGRDMTDLGVCELDNSFMPTNGTNKKLRVPRNTDKVITLDDPRVIVWNNHYWMFYVQGVLNVRGGWYWSSSFNVAKLSLHGEFLKNYVPVYGKNINNASSANSALTTTEKNWTPFIHNNKLHLIYNINPLEVLEFDPDTGMCNLISKQPMREMKKWLWGDFLGGGTPLIRRGNEYVGLFHSFVNEYPGRPNVRSYYAGVYTMSVEPPFRLLRISKKPLMIPVPDEHLDLRGPDACWRPNCVYPCGMIEKNGKIYVSYGWQDCRCWINEYDWNELEAVL